MWRENNKKEGGITQQAVQFDDTSQNLDLPGKKMKKRKGNTSERSTQAWELLAFTVRFRVRWDSTKWRRREREVGSGSRLFILWELKSWTFKSRHFYLAPLSAFLDMVSLGPFPSLLLKIVLDISNFLSLPLFLYISIHYLFGDACNVWQAQL